MVTGTTYEQNKEGMVLARRYHKCRNCHGKVYTKEPNSQERLSKS